ncbi:Flavanone 3-dioxygenase 2 [Asimina triloba]
MGDTVLSTGIRYENLPESYIRPASERPRLKEVVNENIPLIDLGGDDRNGIISQIGEACRSYGFFKIINHGMPEESIRQMMGIAREFFHMPVEEKMKYYSDDPAKKMRLSTSFNVRKETVHNWRDYLRLHCHPLEEFVPDWPSTPASFKYLSIFCYPEGELTSKYCVQVRELGFRLLEMISESLGLEKDYFEKLLGDQGQHMAVNFYPPCPEPELTYGLPGHTDPNTITILLQDQEVAGLQVFKDGKWIAVNPHPEALVVNIGDQIQALSNAQYKSVWHRAVVNSDRERISVASFLCPANDAVIGPAKLLTEDSPAIYRNFTYYEYYKKFWSRNLDEEHCLELFKT